MMGVTGCPCLGMEVSKQMENLAACGEAFHGAVLESVTHGIVSDG